MPKIFVIVDEIGGNTGLFVICHGREGFFPSLLLVPVASIYVKGDVNGGNKKASIDRP